MDAANSAALAIRYAEAAPGITPEDLVARAAAQMEVLIYAARYATAQDIAERIEKRLRAEGFDNALTPVFYHRWARAAFHIGAPGAKGYFREAITRFATMPGNAWDIEELVLDLQDTPWLELQEEAMGLGYRPPATLARLRYRQGRFDEAAALMAERRRQTEAQAAENPNLSAALNAATWQEAFYRNAAGEADLAAALRVSAGEEPPQWRPLSQGLAPDEATGDFATNSSYDYILAILEFRDDGNYEGAANWMRSYRWLAIKAEENGTYLDAQTLWQMAFTFVRAGEADIAFDLMNRAARIAARLSFENAGGADGGSLQLLERDRWRYLLFVDIAWAAVTGKSPQEMSVVSRY